MLSNQVVEKKRKLMAIAEPVMLQERKVLLRRNSNGNEYFHSNHKLFYRHYNILMLLATLLEILKNVFINSIYVKLQNITLKARCCQDFRLELNSLENLYKYKFNFFCIKISAGIAQRSFHH